MDPAYKILAKSPVPVLMAGTPRSVNLPELRNQVLAALGQPNRTGVEGSPTAFEGSSRFGTDPRKFNRPTASGAMENLAGTPLPRRVATDWKSQLDPKKRMQDASKEVASRLKQKLGGTTQDVIGTLLGGPGTLLNKSVMQAREDFAQLNVARDDLKTKMWNAYGHKDPRVKWADLPPETKRSITQRVNEITEAEYVRRGMPGTESVLRELLKDSKVGRESRVSFPLQSPQKGPNESDAAYAKRRAQFMEENKGAIDFYRKTGVVPEDPARSGAIWYDPHAPVDGRQQQFLGGEERFSSKKGMPERYMHRFEEFEFVKKDAFGNPLKGGTPKDVPSPFTPPATKGTLAQADALEDLSRTLWKKLESYTGLAPDEQDAYQKRVSLLSKKLKEAANLFRNDEDEGRVALRKIIPQVHQLNQELDVGAPPFKVTGGGGLVNRASGAKDPLDLLIQQETIERLQRDPTKLIEELPYENLGQVQMGLEQSQPQKLRQALGHLAAPSDYRMAAESQAAVPTPDLPLQSMLAETRTPLDKGTFMGAMERLPGSVSRLGAEGGSFIRNPEGRRFIQEGGSFVEKALRRLAQRL